MGCIEVLTGTNCTATCHTYSDLLSQFESIIYTGHPFVCTNVLAHNLGTFV